MALLVLHICLVFSATFHHLNFNERTKDIHSSPFILYYMVIRYSFPRVFQLMCFFWFVLLQLRILLAYFVEKLELELDILKLVLNCSTDNHNHSNMRY